MLVLLSLSLLALANFSLVGADVVSGQDALNNEKGQTPCEIADLLQQPCQTGAPSLAPNANVSTTGKNSFVQGPSMCTCNTVVYNLWSACVTETLQQPDSEWPPFWAWAQACQNNNISVSYTTYPLNTAGAQDTEVPEWAKLNITSQGTFDMQAAILLQKPKWTIFQKLLPAIVGISFCIISGMIFLVYYLRRRRRDKKDHPSFDFRESTLAKKSSPGKPSTWVIDGEPDQLWAESPKRSRRLAWSLTPPKDRTTFSTKVRSALDRLLRYSWGPPPVAVVSGPPKRGFRMDEDVSSSKASQQSPHATIEIHGRTFTFSRGGTVEGSGGTPQYGDDEPYSSAPRDYDSTSEEEEESVFLISRTPGVDFPDLSSDSHPNSDAIHVIPPPSPSQASMGPNNTYPQYPPGVPKVSTQPSSSDLRDVIRPARDDPVLLVPAAIRAAGYNGRTSPYPIHSRSPSVDTIYTHEPMTPPSMA